MRTHVGVVREAVDAVIRAGAHAERKHERLARHLIAPAPFACMSTLRARTFYMHVDAPRPPGAADMPEQNLA